MPPRLTVAQALGELRQGAGSQFDPTVVDALSELAVELIWPTEAAEDPDKIQASHPT
jgi:response regulator RpfG family c-di-GMP phosphodiesterase